MTTQMKTLIGVGIGFLVAIILVCIGLANNLFISQKEPEPQWIELSSGGSTCYIATKPDSKYEIVQLSLASFKIEKDGEMLFDIPFEYYPTLPEKYKQIKDAGLNHGYGHAGTTLNDILNITVYGKYKDGEMYGIKYVMIQIGAGKDYICCETKMSADEIFTIFRNVLAKR